MNLDAIPLFSMLRSRLGYISERERLIAQNVANADTPGYAPQDLKPFKVQASGQVEAGLPMAQPARTNPAHLTGTQAASGGAGFAPKRGVDSEVTLDGNKVELEDEMAKMTESRLQYEAAIDFYQKSMAILQMAAKAPNK